MCSSALYFSFILPLIKPAKKTKDFQVKLDMLKKRVKRGNIQVNANTDEAKANKEKELSGSDDPPSSNVSPTAMSVSSKSPSSKGRSGSNAVSSSRARLRYVLRTGFPEFRQFSIRSMCVENVDFFDAVQKYKALFPHFTLKDENNLPIDTSELIRSSPTRESRTSLASKGSPSNELKSTTVNVLPDTPTATAGSSRKLITSSSSDTPSSPSASSQPQPEEGKHRRTGSSVRNTKIATVDEASIYLENANNEAKEQYNAAKNIIDTFVKTDAPYQVNFSSNDSQFMASRISPAVYFNLSPRDRYDAFERLEREILALLDQNLLHLFLQSPECDEYLKRIGDNDDTRDLKADK